MGVSGSAKRREMAFLCSKKSVFRFKKVDCPVTRAKDSVESAIYREKPGFWEFRSKHTGKKAGLRGKKASGHQVVARSMNGECRQASGK